MNQTPIKVIAIDMDGTLLNDVKAISAKNQAALAQAISHGIQVVICTGRNYPGVERFLKDMPLSEAKEYVIVNNGGSIHQLPSDAVIHETFLNEAQRCSIYNEVVTKGIPGVQLTSLGHTTLNLIDEVDPNPNLLYDSEQLETEITYITGQDFMQSPCLKAVAFADAEVLDQLEAHLSDELRENINVVRSLDILLEFLPKSVSKASALQWLATELKVSPHEIMAIGDERNDLEMLQFAGRSYAMGNAHPELKEIADYVALNNEEDGVAWAIEHYLGKVH